MNIFKFITYSFFHIISVIFVFVFLLGALNIYFSDKNDYCSMTYMFEYPQFVRVAVPDNKEHPQYSLYAYSEGRLTERARKMWFDGIPVLYLPGSFGSYKQCRSLASVALRTAISNVDDYHFDYFTVDYSEELSGLYGGVLKGQTEYAADCISKILSLYKNNMYVKSVPTTVILIGHSMGGVIAKRLLAYPKTMNSTNIAITLAAPLDAPILNFDILINDYYLQIDREWSYNRKQLDSKLFLSFGSGPRDILMPPSLTGLRDSDINALTTSIPGVWVSPNHVGIVWCKQIVMAINKYLFSIVDVKTKQIINEKDISLKEAYQFFQANRSMTLNPNIHRPTVKMSADGLWYEDNRRIYQISRPVVNKVIYAMIRLVSFPQNRFVAVETVNVDDKDWLFGCNAKDVHGSHRYCTTATSVTELSRWTGAANTFGKRKIAAIDLHKIMDAYPQWTHIIVKVSPTRKPIVVNVDINDYASREIKVDLPYMLSFTKTVIKEVTEKGSLYYQLILQGFELIHHAYNLHVEPVSCNSTKYHASAELHVPWAKNHEYTHYFTSSKKSPMKLRLFKNNPNVTYNLENTDEVKVTILLDPQCTYSISISPSIYDQIAQLVRIYTPLLIPYIAAIVLLAVRSNIVHLLKNGSCISFHRTLMSEGSKPYYILVSARLGITTLMTVPLFSYIFETASLRNIELQYFLRSFLSVPVYMTALGIVNIAVAIILAVMVFSSQLAHRLLFRIVWRGGATNFAEKMASVLQKVPMVVSAALACAVPLSCGAASLAAGAAFYSFMLSKMHEEYLEDYFYKLLAKISSKICYLFKRRKDKNSNNELVAAENLIKKEDEIQNTEKRDENIKNTETPTAEIKALDVANKESSDSNINTNAMVKVENKSTKATMEKETVDEQALVPATNVRENEEKVMTNNCKDVDNNSSDDIDEDLSALNFHMTLFVLWIIVTLVNIPALLTWARNFKYSMVLKPDTSYYSGMIMSVCAGFIWQIGAPQRNLKYYSLLSQVLFGLAVITLVLAPFGLYFINYTVTLAFLLITIQQIFDKDEKKSENNKDMKISPEESQTNETKENTNTNPEDTSSSDTNEELNSTANCECNENRIYKMFKNFRERLNFSEEL